MQKGSRYIIFTAVAVSCISSLYFISLLLGIPVLVTLSVIAVALFFLFRWMMNDKERDEEGYSVWSVSLLIAALGITASTALRVALKHGDWDAWGIWNFHARYMADPQNWKLLFLNTDSAHPDYPLCLPSFLGFFTRLFAGHGTLVIPFVFSFLIMLCIPALIYAEQAKKNMLVAFLVLFFFSRDEFFITRGISQYADTLLAFFFLCAFVCIDHAENNKKNIVLSAFCLASCAWTKNEGIMLALLFLVFYAPVFFVPRNLLYTIIGLLVPTLMVVILKVDLYSANDLITGNSRPLLPILQDGARWSMVWQSFLKNLNDHFYWIKISMYIYGLACLVQRKIPGRLMLLLLTCTFAYMVVYVLTPHDLSWHLQTSQDRVMHQLMPAFVYVLAKFADFKFLTLKKQAF